jgi:hypothetical protein
MHFRARTPSRRSPTGQSLVEFALVLPILLVLFVAIADFGRYFAVGVAVEAATRDAAEAVANEYLANPPGDLDAPPVPPGGQAYYDGLHTYGANIVCTELRSLPNTNFDTATGTCPDMPAVLVCIHDGVDENSGCGARSDPGTTPIPTECTEFAPPPTHDQVTTVDGTPRWVEVRTCYHFTALLTLPIFSMGDFWVQRSRNFTIPCYFVRNADECGQ